MTDRNMEITLAAEQTCGGFRSDVSEIGKLAFKLGAQWADNNPKNAIEITRNADGLFTKDFEDFLKKIPSNKSCIARKSDGTCYLLDPEIHMINEYVILREFIEFTHIFIIDMI